jgi:hypothetical protein
MKLRNKRLTKKEEELWKVFSNEIVYGDLLKFMFRVTAKEHENKTLELLNKNLYDKCIAWFELYKIIEDEVHDMIDSQEDVQ